MGEQTGLLWPWTEADQARVFDQHAKGVRVLCPIDETPLRVVKRDGFVRFRCLRCGNTSTKEASEPNSSDQR
jgi:transposase-like protein